MTVTAQAGLFGFGFQEDGAKGGDITTWYQHRALNIDLAELDDTRVAPPEIGGIPTPSAAYKAGVMCAGGVAIYPRLTSTFGQLLLGAMGACSTEVDKDIDGAIATGLNTHTFKFGTNKSFVPYMGFRKLIPADVAADELGIDYVDGKILGLTFNFPNDDLISTRLDIMAREYSYTEAPVWTFSNTYEEFDSIPVGVSQLGSIKFDGTALPVVAATVSMVNTPLDPRQERVYGSPFLHGITVVNRAMTFDLIVRWENPDLYQKLSTGIAAGTAWTAKPFTGAVVLDSASAMDIGAVAPLNVPWRMRIDAARVVLAPNGGITLASGQSVMMRFTGTALAPSAGEYATIKVQNQTATYEVPVSTP